MTTTRSTEMHEPRTRRWILLGFCVLYVAVRLPVLSAQGLWLDEAFSLAMATGHSLEHPAGAADPDQGDYVEELKPMPAAHYAAHLRHESPPASSGRTIRAVGLSDTSPPFYYLTLRYWTLLIGTADEALRGFSALWGLLCVPLVFALASDFGGRHAVVPTLLLFTMAPICVYYTTEGRMYSLLLFLSIALIWLTRRLEHVQRMGHLWLGWIAVGTAGLMTHYFFAFVLAVAASWLLLRSRAQGRWWTAGACGVVLLAVLPWYLRVPTLLEQWRVTAGWLEVDPQLGTMYSASLFLVIGLLSIRGSWGVHGILFGLDGLIYVVLTMLVLRHHAAWLFGGRRRLLWLWLAAPVLGVIGVGWVTESYLAWNLRYGLTALPAAQLLVGVCVSRLSPQLRRVFSLLIVVTSCVGLYFAFSAPRLSLPLEATARNLVQVVGQGEIVVVQSIPSGVTGLSRYLEKERPDVGVVSWVDRLERRRPEDLMALLVDEQQLFLVTAGNAVHLGDELVRWLRAHARLELIEQAGEISVYRVTLDTSGSSEPSARS